MSYWRPVKLQPPRLEVAASQCWARALVSVLSLSRHIFSEHSCLRLIRHRLQHYLRALVPPSVEETLFQAGLEMMRRESGVDIARMAGLASPDMFVLYMFVLYRSNIKSLDIPALSNHRDRVTVLDLLYNVGAQHGHQLDTIKIKMFESVNISIEENYLTKRVLRGFHSLHSLVLWRVADDAMLQIIGLTSRSLVSLDLWKCVKVTDTGLRMMLGLDGPVKTKISSSLEKVIIKDTSVSDEGGFSLLSNCPNLYSLEFSHGTFIKQFLDRIEDNYVKTGSIFPLRSIFLPVSSQNSLYNVIKSFPRLQELSLWTQLSHVPRLEAGDLKHVETLKLGGLGNSSLLTDMTGIIGQQLLCLKIETVHFDINTDIIAYYCPNLEELSIINARLCVTHPTEKTPFYPDTIMFSRLTKLYLFLVTFTPVGPAPSDPASVCDPARARAPATGLTSLHSILASARSLQVVTVTGTAALTDACLASILASNPLSSLKRLVISLPGSHDQLLVIPLTLVSVLALAQSCPSLQCVGDLRHWAISPGHRRDISSMQHCGELSVGSVHQSVWTRLRIAGGQAGVRSSSVCLQRLVTTS